jgi:hypothetical protein
MCVLAHGIQDTAPQVQLPAVEQHMSTASHRRLGLLVTATLASLGLVGVSAPAHAVAGGTGHTETATHNVHGTTSFQEVNPCTFGPLDVEATFNIVQHVTYFPESDEAWATSTEEESVVATDLTTGVVYTGHATFWGNYIMNDQISTSTFTASLAVTGSDGSVITYGEVNHFTLAANGEVTVSFEKPRLACG